VEIKRNLARMLAWTFFVVVTVQAFGQKPCEQLSQLKIAATTIDSAETLAAGTLQIPPNPMNVVKPSEAPAFCRVKGTSKPSADSEIHFEVWMPASAWNGRFVQMGSGGLAGHIDPTPLLARLKEGSAVAGTDDGHQGTPVDGAWAIGHPEKVRDFGYRAVHETNVAAKQIINAFYGSGAKYSYFNGCSEGGREALMEAQRYPLDFNGILVGAPGHYWTKLMAGFVWNAQALSSPTSFISEAKRKTVENAAIAACGKQSGVEDKFIKDPVACHFDPKTLLCKGQETDACLTAPQLEALDKIYSGPKDPSTGQPMGGGYVPGAEAEQGIPGITFASYVFGPAPGASLDAMFSSSFYGSFVFEDPKWKFSDFKFGKDIATTDQKVGAVLNADNPNLKEFKAAGGKMLHYHGWNDGSPSPWHSVDYYERVVKTMGGVEKTQAFYRLYMVPGMMHCITGPGPNMFGNAFDQKPASDPEHNIFVALEQWVEQGKAPRNIIATKYVEDSPSKGVEMTRPLCAYPQIAAWSGKGSPNEASTWTCQAKAEAGKK